MKQFIGLIGCPLKHSISPDFQQAALDYCGLDIAYQAWETEAKDLPPAISKLRLAPNLGANMTVPYKERVIPLVDEIDSFASVIGAVNTVVNREGRLIGSNTDADGFLRALLEKARFQPEGKRTAILGAGGAARAVSFALVTQKIGTLAVSNRHSARAESLVQSLEKYISDNQLTSKVVSIQWRSSEFQEVINNSQLIVNCTTIGMKFSAHEKKSPLAQGLIRKGALVYDLVYNPLETPLLIMAREEGADVIGGLPMLVYQGGASFKLWTGREPPIDIMFAAAQEALMRMRG